MMTRNAGQPLARPALTCALRVLETCHPPTIAITGSYQLHTHLCRWERERRYGRCTAIPHRRRVSPVMGTRTNDARRTPEQSAEASRQQHLEAP